MMAVSTGKTIYNSYVMSQIDCSVQEALQAEWIFEMQK